MQNLGILAACARAGFVLAVLTLAPTARAETPRPLRGPLAERELVVVNRADRPINEIYVSAANDDNWGEDRLDEATLAPNASLKIRLGRTTDCSFDVRIIFEDATSETHTGLDVCHSRTLLAPGRDATPLPGIARTVHVVTLENDSPRPIRQVFISPAYAEQWGDDLLSSEIPQGAAVQIPYRGDCAADLRVVFANRAAEERRGLDLCAAAKLAITPGWTTADDPPAAHTPATAAN